MAALVTRSALLHLRIPFSFFLLPVFVFALSQVADVNLLKSIVVFVVWHLFAYPASNGYNSYFDKDEGSIALLEKPPAVDKTLYYLSLILELIAIVIAGCVSLEFALAVFIYGVLSKLYSHPSTRLKKYPVISFFVVFIFQGAFVYWTTYAAISDTSIFNMKDDSNFILAGLICSCLIGASYPLTQVYQHEEDSKRGDKTLSLLLGIKGSFFFSAILFAGGILSLFFYWNTKSDVNKFWIFLAFALPVLLTFIDWLLKVLKDEKQADFRNMTRMTVISSAMMLAYFLVLLILK